MAGKKDDLTRIKGLGRGSQKLLRQAGISTFQQLASCSDERIRKALARGGPPYTSFDCSHWSSEANRLANQSKSPRSAKPSRTHNATPDHSPRQAGRAGESAKSRVDPRPVPVVFSSMDSGDWIPGTPFRIERILTHAEADLEYQTRKDELDSAFARAHDAIQSLLDVYTKATNRTGGRIAYAHGEPPEYQVAKLIQERQITAVSARYRTKFGHPVSPLRVVICINVARKQDVNDLAPEDILPREYAGIPIKVVEGTFRFLASDTGSFLRGRCEPAKPISFDKPIVGGVPIAPAQVPCDFGTLGFAFMAASQLFGLTCHHVVKGEANTIVQLGTSHAWRRFAKVVSTVAPANRNGTSAVPLADSVDCALVSIATPEPVSPDEESNVINPPSGFVWTRGLSHKVDSPPPDTPTHRIYLADAPITRGNTEGLPLYKFGNGTGQLLKGRVGTTAHGPVWIDSDDGKFDFKNNFSVHREDSGRGFVAGGDSGSIVALKAEVHGEVAFVAIGVLFAALGDDSIGLACSMRSVIRALDLRAQLDDDALFVDHWFALPGN